jgi:hypothetical protein
MHLSASIINRSDPDPSHLMGTRQTAPMTEAEEEFHHG